MLYVSSLHELEIILIVHKIDHKIPKKCKYIMQCSVWEQVVKIFKFSVLKMAATPLIRNITYQFLKI